MNSVFLNLLFPNCCVCCRKVSDEAICGKCRKAENLFKYGSHIDISLGGICDAVKSCDVIFALCKYRGKMQESIVDYKFNGNTWIGRSLAELIYEMLENAGATTHFDAITYVPISKSKMTSRGFDQSEFIAKILSKKTKKPLFHLFERVLQGKTQSKSGRQERAKQSRSRFELCDSLSGSLPERILLFDDILTTGATLEEAAKLLKSAGIKKVIGCIIATGRNDI